MAPGRDVEKFWITYTLYSVIVLRTLITFMKHLSWKLNFFKWKWFQKEKKLRKNSKKYLVRTSYGKLECFEYHVRYNLCHKKKKMTPRRMTMTHFFTYSCNYEILKTDDSRTKFIKTFINFYNFPLWNIYLLKFIYYF